MVLYKDGARFADGFPPFTFLSKILCFFVSVSSDLFLDKDCFSKVSVCCFLHKRADVSKEILLLHCVFLRFSSGGVVVKEERKLVLSFVRSVGTYSIGKKKRRS